MQLQSDTTSFLSTSLVSCTVCQFTLNIFQSQFLNKPISADEPNFLVRSSWNSKAQEGTMCSFSLNTCIGGRERCGGDREYESVSASEQTRAIAKHAAGVPSVRSHSLASQGSPLTFRPSNERVSTDKPESMRPSFDRTKN
jgi:hypothetical protein